MKLPVRKAIAVVALMVAASLIATGLSSCVSVSPYFDADKPHRARAGFRNNYDNSDKQSFWRWQLERWQSGVPFPPKAPTPTAIPETDYLRTNATEPSITWIGHATVLLQVASYNILTDPHFSERASPVSFSGPKRMAPPGIPIDQLPHIDVVLISHNHYDHLDLATVKRLAAQEGGPPMFVVPLGLEAWFKSAGITNVVELDWWDRVRLGSLDFHLVPVQHWSQRTLFDRNQSLWGGFFVKHHSLSFVYTGDTGYSKDFSDIRARLGAPHIAVIPVGAYEPRWFMRDHHINPDEAVKILQLCGAQQALAHHWGTFQLTDEPVDEPPRLLQVALDRENIASSRFQVKRPGEVLDIAVS